MNSFTRDGVTLIDVSHKVTDGMMTYKGLPTPIICDYLTREAAEQTFQKGVTFQIGVITMCSNTGTYIDVPFHRFAAGKDLAQFPLDSLANLDAIKVVIPTHTRKIDAQSFAQLDVRGKAVLIQTGWSQHWGSDTYFEKHPHLTSEAALALRDGGALLVGIDSYNIDDTNDPARPVHTTLLGSDIAICEHMTNLESLPSNAFRFFAVPVKVEGMGTFPVRAFGLT
ncbi:MAG: cyclase family protein [Gammaproteobacteria bacterium]